jgi:PST family polysaccharide transporter
MSGGAARREGNFRSGLMLLLSTGCDVLMPFARSVTLARLITPDQLGLATTIAVAASLAEVITDIGLTSSAIRQRGASQEDVLPTLQTIRLFRATLLGLFLAIGGIPLATLFHAPEAGWSFSMLGLVSFIYGFANMQVTQMIRDYVYGPDSLAAATEQVAWTLVTIGTASVLRDYRCMLAGILVGAVGYVVMTHLMSPTRWRLGWSREVAREALVYGVPLVPNGMAVAFSGMGDRLLIGALLGLDHLAAYNIAAMAAFMPRSIILRLLMAVAVPAFVNSGRDHAAAMRAFDYWSVLLAAIASIYSLSFLCFGSFLVGLVFGAVYEPSQALASLFAISVYLKFLLNLPTPIALAFGETWFILGTSVIAASAVFCGAVAVLAMPLLTSFMLGVAGGEFLAVLWVIARTFRLYPFHPRLAWFATMGPLVVIVGAHAVCTLLSPGDLMSRIQVYAIGSLAFCAIFGMVVRLAELPVVPVFLRRA